MKKRTTTAGTRFYVRLTAVSFAAVLASASVVACTGSSHPTPPKLSPGVASSASSSTSPGPSVTTTTPSAAPSATPSASARPSATRTTSASAIPTAAPATGGGGTAGFQGAWLLGLGAVLILAGAGCIAYCARRIWNR
jgi:hypothetical protein